MAGTMASYHCDKCGTEIKGSIMERKCIKVSINNLWSAELCEACARPVTRLLQRSHLLEKELQQHGFIPAPEH